MFIAWASRCNRSKAQYLHDQNLVCVTKIVGTISQYGFHNKNGKFLNAEEALFLLETVRAAYGTTVYCFLVCFRIELRYFGKKCH